MCLLFSVLPFLDHTLFDFHAKAPPVVVILQLEVLFSTSVFSEILRPDIQAFTDNIDTD